MKTALIYRQAEMLFHGVQKARARFGMHLAADETIEAEVGIRGFRVLIDHRLDVELEVHTIATL